MEEINKHILKQAISKLPSHKPKKDLWAEIEKELDNDNKLKNVIDQLPKYSPDEKLWEKIDEKLELNTRIISIYKHENRRVVSFLKIAATVLVLISIGGITAKILSTNANENKEQIVYSEEIIETNTISVDESSVSENKKLTAFINQACQAMPDVCGKPEFADLKNQLQDLQNEQEKLKKSIKKNSDNTELLKYQLEIENEIGDVSKQLIQQLI